MSLYQDNLKPFKRNFLLATALFLVVTMAFSHQKRERKILEIKQRELAPSKEVLPRIQTAIQDRRTALTTIKSHFAVNAPKITSARQIYSLVDEMTARYKPDDMTIGSLENKDGDVTLKYTLNFSKIDYSALLNTIGQLQSSLFPFTPVESVTISQRENQGRAEVLYVITGRIISIEGAKP